MQSMIFPILIAVTVALLAWGVYSLLATSLKGEKRKLKARLNVVGNYQETQQISRSITVQQVSGISGSLARISMLERLNRRLVQAYPETTLAKFMGIMGWMAVGSFLMITFITDSLLLGLIAGVVGGYVPLFQLNRKRNSRQRRMAAQLPEALDFLSRVLRAGHSFSTGLQLMADELPQPLAGELRRTYDQHSLGQSLEEALKDMASRVDSTDFAFFVTAVLIQRQTGGDLSEVLRNISGMIRARIRLQQSVKAKTAEGRLTGYILVAFPFLMFCLAYALNPHYGEVLLHTSTGLWLLGTAVALQMAGLFAIRKITNLRV
jgi:tight adherence protein B